MSRLKNKPWMAPLATLAAAPPTGLDEGELGIALETGLFYRRPDNNPSGGLIQLGSVPGAAGPTGPVGSGLAGSTGPTGPNVLNSTGVIAGTYAGTTVTVGADGRITGATGTAYVLVGAARTLATADGNFFVSTTGSDTTGDGTVGNPFLTMQHCWNVVCNLWDFAGWNVFINLAAGTYTQGLVTFIYPLGAASVTISGASNGNPDLTLINVVAGNCFLFSCVGRVTVQGMKLTTTGASQAFVSQGVGIIAQSNAVVTFRYMDFGTCGYAHLLTSQATLGVDSTSAGTVPYTISGSSQIHMGSTPGAVMIIAGAIVTFVGTPNFAVGFAVGLGGAMAFYFNTVNGNCSGPQYNLQDGCWLATNGGYTSMPGSVAGTVGPTSVVN
jgi:hypothetical protein